MRLAIFGGTFDPIHKAHLAVARQAADRFRLDRVLFVPAAHPPHKWGGARAGYAHRIRMVELACQADPRFEASRLEEDTARSYSIDTIEKVLASSAPGDEVFFLLGADAFAEIETWLRWRDVARLVRFIVVSRPDHSYRVPPGVSADRMDDVELRVSSSDVRRQLAAGAPPEEVPERVLEYISRHNLYRSPALSPAT